MTLLSKGWRIAVTLAVGTALVVLRANPAFAAAPPSNDDFSFANTI